MKELISAINKLQDVFNTLHLPNSIQLPQIVMLGSQSTGKSSVLESIVHRPFLPRGTGIVTRCPLVLQLIECKENDVKYRRKEDGTADVKEWGEFLHARGKIFTDFDDIREEIEQQTIKIAGANKGICKEPINLKIYSTGVVNLTLVDLPGITKVPVGDQPVDIEEQIKELVFEYIRNPNSIILSVSAANVDLATSESLKYAREFDPEGKRTLAVLTKIDLMDKGTDAHDVLNGNVIDVKHGIVGVINRSQHDIDHNKTIDEQLKDEKNFFEEHYSGIASRQGISHLEHKLNKLLMEHIFECLPGLKKEIRLKSLDWKNVFDLCGQEISDPEQLFLKIVTDVKNDFCGIINGSFVKVSKNLQTLIGGPRMREIFDDSLAGEISAINPDILHEGIINYIKRNGGPRPDLFAPEKLFEQLVVENVERLRLPSLDCLSKIHDEIDKIIKHVLAGNFELKRFPRLAAKMKHILTELLSERLPETESRIKYMIDTEQSSLNKNHPDFSVEEALHAFENESDDDDNDEHRLCSDLKKKKAQVVKKRTERHAQIIEMLIANYFPIVKKTVTDLTPKIIMNSMVNDMMSNADKRLMVLYKESDTLMCESKDNTERRIEAKKMLDALKTAEKTINEVYESEV